MSCFSDGQLEEDSEHEDFGVPIIKLKDFILTKKLEATEKNSSSFNEQDLTSGQQNQPYNTIRDNKFFNKFAIKYNNNLLTRFDEADKQAAEKQLNSSGGAQ